MDERRIPPRDLDLERELRNAEVVAWLSSEPLPPDYSDESLRVGREDAEEQEILDEIEAERIERLRRPPSDVEGYEHRSDNDDTSTDS